MIRLQSVGFHHGDMKMHFEADLPSGTFTIVIGPSGAGKSTLLNLIAGFDRADSGRILLKGQDMTDAPPVERPVTTLFQDHNLFAHLTVAQNVGLGRSPALKLSAQDHQDIAEALAQVGLDTMHDRLPRALSGGERQRAALARSLVQRREILLLDEPFAALGPAQRQQMAQLVDQLRRNHGLTVLMVTHQLDEVAGTNLPALFLDAGKITATGTVDTFLKTPELPEIAAYLGTGALKR